MGFIQDICFLLSAGTVFTLVYFKVESSARLWLWVIFDWKNSFLMVNTCFQTWFQDGKCSYWSQLTVIKRPLQTVIFISELFLISYNLKLYIFFLSSSTWYSIYLWYWRTFKSLCQRFTWNISQLSSLLIMKVFIVHLAKQTTSFSVIDLVGFFKDFIN